jgi:hypothetical protein
MEMLIGKFAVAELVSGKIPEYAPEVFMEVFMLLQCALEVYQQTPTTTLEHKAYSMAMQVRGIYRNSHILVGYMDAGIPASSAPVQTICENIRESLDSFYESYENVVVKSFFLEGVFGEGTEE